MSLLGESHHLEAEEENQEAPKELVITLPCTPFKLGANGAMVVIVPEKKQ